MAGPADVDHLYGLDRSEFIPSRDALARELRSTGRRQEAAAVKQARKPTLAAWALDQVARRHPDEVEALLRAGAALTAEQEAALAGDAAGLREAGRALADAVDRIAGLAAGFLDTPSALQRERITTTLRAAATDEGAAELLRRGVLVEDLEASGFGLGGAATGAVSGAGSRAPSRRPPAPSRARASEAVDAARRDLRRLQTEAEAAETRARRRAERAEAAVRRAAEAHREAEAQRVEAEEAAAEAVAARRAAEEAAARLAAAEEADEGPSDAT